MSRLLFTFLLTAFSWSAWSAPVCVDPEQPERNHPVRGGIGGTGSPVDHSTSGGHSTTSGGGIGGTGSPLADGTPIGIVGVLSGFASICVNGIEVHFDSATPVNDNSEPSSAEKLAVGNVVSIEALPSAKGLQARSIAILHALEGPITKVARGGKTIEVIGQTVNIGPDTRTATANLAPGQLVKVSALTGANGQLFATRIQAAPELKQAGTLGPVLHDGKQALVNGVPVNGAVRTPSAAVKGNWTGRELIPSSIAPDPTYRFTGNVGRILLEGLVQNADGHGKFKAAGLELNAANTVNNQGTTLKPNQRVFVEATVGRTGSITANRIELVKPGKGFSGTTGTNRSSPMPRIELPSKADEIEKAEVPERAENMEMARAEKTERSERAEKAERSERTERAEKTERTERSERAEKTERAERSERSEKMERAEKVERVRQGERVERR